MAARPRIDAFACEGDARRPFTVRGQTARALHALVAAGPRGVTALDVSGTWAYRFAAYCHKLRTRYGLAIRTDRESHPGGWHGRHVLETPVVIDAIHEPANRLEQDGDPRPSGLTQAESPHGPA
jgi:hypothetical protein